MALAQCALVAAMAGLLLGCDSRSYPRSLPEVQTPPRWLPRRNERPTKAPGIATLAPSLAELDRAPRADVCDLIHRPADFDGQLLRVSGAYSHEVEGMLLGSRNCAGERRICLAFVASQDASRGTILNDFAYRDREQYLRMIGYGVADVSVVGEFQNGGECVFGSGKSWLVIHRVDDIQPSTPTR